MQRSIVKKQTHKKEIKFEVDGGGVRRQELDEVVRKYQLAVKNKS